MAGRRRGAPSRRRAALGVPFLTSWYKGFREQNLFKHGYNSVMARGDRVVAVSEQIADLIVERHCTPRTRITVIPPAVDFDAFDPGALTAERIEKMRAAWGVPAGAEVVLVAGRMLRRKGHHVVVRAAERLKTMGRQDVLFVFAGEDQGRSRYTGELWDLVLSTGTADIVRMAGPHRRHAGRLCGRRRGGVGGGAAGGPATLDPGKSRHGAAGTGIRSRRRHRHRADPTGGA